MKTYRVDNIEKYSSPESPYWGRLKNTQISLMPTPLGLQPTDYIRQSWKDREYGQTPSVAVASVHDGKSWALRAEWVGGKDGIHEFPDSFAVALPVKNYPVMATMGGKDAPIHILRWASDLDSLESVLATGIGSSRQGGQLNTSVEMVSEGDVNALVMSRPLGVGDDIAPLREGYNTGIGFALWFGGNEERAGIKAFSIDWTPLEMEE